MLGYKPPEANQRKSTCLKSDDPRWANCYIKQVTQQFEKMDLTKQTEDMWRETEWGWTQDLERKYNAIHEETYSICQDTENKLVYLGSGSMPWSPRLKKVGGVIKYWKLALNQANGQRISVKILYQLAKLLSVSSVGIGADAITDTLDDAYAAYKWVKKKAWGYMKMYLRDKALVLEKDDSLKASKHL